MSGITVPLPRLRKVSIAIFFVFVSFAHAQIVSVSPQQNAIHVPVATSLSATFGEAMNAASLNDTTFRIWGMQSGLHKGGINYNANTKQATLVPTKSFAPGELVSVMLTKAIRTAGNKALTSFGWSFNIATDTAPGRFYHKVDYSLAGTPTTICAADFDGDGDRDLATGNYSTFSLSLAQNNGGGTFQIMQDYKIKSVPWAITAADLDNDGDIDLAVARNPNLL
ncbi:MAG: FG-GAP-like repeat-containing protein, partial [candidate division KSB1 bacterium]